ncbi:MAG: hypothetical protein V3W52_17175 [Syntrophobacteria bacterium]
MTQKYQPSNHSEGSAFEALFCGRCKKDAYFRKNLEDGCEVYRNMMLHKIDEPGYPKEWVMDDEGYPGNPRCTAFEQQEGE